MTILDKIVANKRKEVQVREMLKPLSDIKKLTDCSEPPRDFKAAISRENINIIAEIKKASPSAGIIRKDFDPVHIAWQYQMAGAAALSALTDEKYFLGKLDFIPGIRKAVEIPILQKDFIISFYQIYEAKGLGADCILLIVKILTDKELLEYLMCARSLGLSALVEVHDEEELNRALAGGADIIGINNRNLADFSVDITTTLRLAGRIPGDKIIVSESGIQTLSDIRTLQEAGVNAFLIGESLLRQDNPGEALKKLISG